MRLPWLQVDADGLTRARLLGRLLGLHEHHGVGLALALWSWALEMSPEGDFSGNVPGDPELLAAALSWPIGEADRLLSNLQRVGLVATTPNLRVRGLDRYKRAWEKNQRRNLGIKPENVNPLNFGDRVPVTGNMRAGTGAEPAKTGAEPARKTETETEKKDFLGPETPKPAKKARRLSAAEEFFAWLSARRAEKTKLSDQAHTIAAVNAVFGRALTDVGRSQLEAKYLAYLDDPDGASKEPPWPWRGFSARYQTLRAQTSQRQTKALSAEERRDLYSQGAA